MELANIADVKSHIISPRFSATIIKLKQDTVIGSYLMTRENQIIDWHDAMNLIMSTRNINKKIPKEHIKNSKLFSMIIPNRINVKEKKIQITNGSIQNGMIDSGVLNKSIINFCWDKYGAETTKNFIDNSQLLICNYLLYNGFSVGVMDGRLTPEKQDTIMKIVEEKKIEAEHMLTEIENNPDLLDPVLAEDQIRDLLATIKGDLGKIVMKEVDKTNNFYIMIGSETKGGPINIGQIAGSLGQDILKFSRIEKKVNNRSLVHFCQNDDTPEARGFITNSYFNGLTPTEFFFHHMSGREGLIDTAIRTADSGYLQRKLIKGLEDIYIAYDGTVRSANNTIIQLFYGDNMLDQEMQKLVKINLIDMSNTELLNKYKFTDSELAKLVKKEKLKKMAEWNESNFKTIMKYREDIREISTKARLDYVTHQYMYFQPANYNRIIEDAKNYIYSKDEPLNIDYVLENLNKLQDPKVCQLTCMTEKEYNNIIQSNSEVQYSKNYNQLRSKYLFTIALNEYLSPKRCILEYKLNKEQFDQIIEEIILSFNKSIVQSGEMVGIVTSQSLGEPLTQLTLNTFHATGSGVKGMQGIPRFRELLSYTKNPNTPYMTIYLNDNIKKDIDKTNKIAALLNYTILNDMAEKIELIYDIDPYNNSYIKEDNIVDIPFYINNVSDINLATLSWLARIELNKESLLENNLTLLDIKSRFVSFWNTKYSDLSVLKKGEKDIIQKILNCCILSSNDNSPKCYLHIRFDLMEINNDIINGIINIVLKKFNIKGNENIKKLDITYNQQTIGYDEDMKIYNDTENMMYTVGIDMLTIRDIKGINLDRTLCNDINTVYTLYGIEAARAMLIYEYTNIFNETKTNYTHINLLVDVMTNNGTIVSIDRHGLNRLETDPLGRVSFEKTIEQLLTAAVFGEKDYLKGVSSRVMVGKCIRGGTGLCDVLIDTDIIEKTEVDNNSAYTSDYNTKLQLHSSEILDDIMNRNEFETMMPFN